MARNGSMSARGSNLTRTFTLTSGKGGVGKSTLAANIALYWGRQGYRVLVFDGDMGMSNLDIMFGVRPQRTIDDVVKGNCRLEDILIEVVPNVFLVPGGSGIKDLQNLESMQRQILVDGVGQLPMSFDFMLIDTGPGIDDNVLYLNAASQDINVVVTPDPSSLTDAYALIKVLHNHYKQDRFSIICNQVKSDEEGLRIFEHLSDVASRFLYVGLDYRGSIPADPYLRKATKSQQLIVKAQGDSPSARSIKEVSEKLSGFKGMEVCKGGIQFFWEQYFGVA